MLFAHLVRAAASRTFWTAGRSRPIRIAMIAITTNNSIRVKARRSRPVDIMAPRNKKGTRTGERRVAHEYNLSGPKVTHFWAVTVIPANAGRVSARPDRQFAIIRVAPFAYCIERRRPLGLRQQRTHSA